MNPSSKRPRVPVAQPGEVYNARGVSLYFIFASGCPLIPFFSKFTTPLREGNQWQMWEFIRI